MKSLPLYVLLILAVGEEYRSFVAKGNSDDLSRALGALQRRRRYLEAGLSPDLDNFRHQYGTVTHYPSARKKSYLSSNVYDSIASVPPNDLWRNHGQQEEEDEKRDEEAEEAKRMLVMKMKKKKSAFREREHVLEEERKRRRRKRLLVRKRQEDDGHWGDTEDELRAMGRQRFLEAVLPDGPGKDGEFLQDLREEDIAALVDLLRKDLAETLDQQRYMEGEGALENENKKRMLMAVKKRLMWQDGFRQALGDEPGLAKRREMVGDGWQSSSSEEEPEAGQKWWSLADPKMLTALSQIEDGEYGRFDPSDEDHENDESEENSVYRKREADPWYPAYDIRKRNRNHLWSAYTPSSSLFKRLVPLKRKRGGSPFRERSTHDPGMIAYVGTSKRSAPIKRGPEEPVAVTKRMVANKSTEPHVLNELKSLLADEKEGKKVAKRDEGDQAESLEEDDVDGVATLPEALVDSSDDDELSEEQLNELMLDDDAKRKRKRSWDDYFGMDKRSVAKRDGANASDDVKVTNESGSPQEGSMHNLNEWMMNRYFKSMAAAMSSKKKRTTDEEEEEEDNKRDQEEVGSGHHPLLAMDRRLEAIENLMLEEALEMVEGRGAGDGDNAEEQREKIVHRLDAAHSLEKMREALAEFEHSLDRIHDDGENGDESGDEDEDKKKKKKNKKADPEKQNLVEALHVMAPQSTKRTSLNDGDDDSTEKRECPVFTEIAMLCTELSNVAGDSQRSLVGACSRHVMCYACDYAYDEVPRIPCDLIFMREAHEICGDNLYCRSAAAQMHGVLRERVPAMRKSNANVCLSAACVKAYRRR